jgi:hypothetical protein
MISRIIFYIDNLFGAVLLIINRIQVKLIFEISFILDGWKQLSTFMETSESVDIWYDNFILYQT